MIDSKLDNIPNSFFDQTFASTIEAEESAYNLNQSTFANMDTKISVNNDHQTGELFMFLAAKKVAKLISDQGRLKWKRIA